MCVCRPPCRHPWRGGNVQPGAHHRQRERRARSARRGGRTPVGWGVRLIGGRYLAWQAGDCGAGRPREGTCHHRGPHHSAPWRIRAWRLYSWPWRCLRRRAKRRLCPRWGGITAHWILRRFDTGTPRALWVPGPDCKFPPVSWLGAHHPSGRRQVRSRSSQIWGRRRGSKPARLRVRHRAGLLHWPQHALLPPLSPASGRLRPQ
mmetsp:Transcript_34761/g.78780  ORF Transcript_34761/g.78780 Transcript_34761/m.78780 type:complete len:204 (+) Transcript_34761:188-799(+)